MVHIKLNETLIPQASRMLFCATICPRKDIMRPQSVYRAYRFDFIIVSILLYNVYYLTSNKQWILKLLLKLNQVESKIKYKYAFYKLQPNLR